MLQITRSLPWMLCTLLVGAGQLASAQICEGPIALRTQADVDAFACSEVRGDLEIGAEPGGQPAVSNVDALSSLERVSTLRITNTRLTDLSPWPLLRGVGELWVHGNDYLESIMGDEYVYAVRISVYDNPNLVNMYIWEGCGSLLIRNNGELRSVNGKVASRVDRSVTIDNNDKIDTLNVLSDVRSVARGINILGNRNLKHIGLNSLWLSESSFRIENNDSLRNINSLRSLEDTGPFTIAGNGSLCNCAGGIGRLVGRGGIRGGLTLSGNHPSGDCNDAASIVDAYENGTSYECEAEEPSGGEEPIGGGEPEEDVRLSVFPNPASAILELRFSTREAGDATLTLFDVLGRYVAQSFSGEVQGEHAVSLDVSSYTAGTYLAYLVIGDRRETVRFSVVR